MLYNVDMFYMTLLLAKLSKFVVTFLRLGTGATFPGYLALKLYPKLLYHSTFAFKQGVVLISGTNGKTTTASLLTHICLSAKYSVVHNETGSNLLRGIASELIANFKLFKGFSAEIGVFEVDEATLPLAVAAFSTAPHLTLVLLNLSRDQLDRYWEIDKLISMWQRTLQKVPANTTHLILYKNSDVIASLATSFKGDIHYFDSSEKRFFKETSLVGNFNVCNVNAAVITGKSLGISEEVICRALSSFKVAYGRGESVPFKDKTFKLFLAKNPASFNNNLTTFLEESTSVETVFFILNDNIPDGRDVSWIYDIDLDKLHDFCKDKQIYVGGTRAFDMAVRLSYAGVFVALDSVNTSVSFLLDKITASSSTSNVLVLPNYSAMLHARELLVGRKIL